MEDERQSQQPSAVVPFLGRRWVIPHSLAVLLAVALPFIDPEVWDWTTAVGAGGFFGAMVALDLLFDLRQRKPYPAPSPMPGELQSARRMHPLQWLAVGLVMISMLTLIYAAWTGTGL